jgi:hypothetical protein
MHDMPLRVVMQGDPTAAVKRKNKRCVCCPAQSDENLDPLAGNPPRTDFPRLGQAFWGDYITI